MEDPVVTKYNLFLNFDSLSPEYIVNEFRRMYPNVGTTSSQLSKFKRTLRQHGANEVKVDKLKLSKEEYKNIVTSYRETRDARSRDVVLFKNPHSIFVRARQLIESTDFRDLWPACIALSGFRPMDILTTVLGKPKRKHLNPDFWVAVTNVAKKKRAEKQTTFEHPLLCSRKHFLRAVSIIRAYFLADPDLSKSALSQRYSKYWESLLDKAFKGLDIDFKITHVILRKWYAKYAYSWFKDDFLPAHITEHGFVAFALMHESNEPALAYGNLAFASDVEGPDIFNVQVGAGTQLHTKASRQPRLHTTLFFRSL